MGLFILLAILAGVGGALAYANGYKWTGILFLVVLIVCIYFAATSQDAQKGRKHFMSGVTGLTRIVEMKDMGGKVLEHYEGTMKIETIPGGVSFINDAGKEVKLLGGIITVKEQ